MRDIPELSHKKNILGKISSWLIDRYRVVFLMIILIVISGVFSYQSMPKESFPDMEINYIFVSTSYIGASVEDVEKLVSDKLEDNLDGLDDLKKITSTSSPSFSQVILEFEDGTDMDQAKIDVQNKVNKTSFPDGVSEPDIRQMETGEIAIMNLTVTGDYDLIELNDYGKTLQDKLEAVSGVKRVDLSGGKEREIRLSLDKNAMYEYGISINDIKNVLQSNSIQLPLGDTDLDHINYTLRVDETIKTVNQLEKTIIPTAGESTIFLSDVAKISDNHKTPTSEAYTYTKNLSKELKATPVITLEVFRDTGADIIGISSEVNEFIDKTVGKDFPEDLNIIITSDDSVEVSENLNTVIQSALGGLLVVIAVLFVFIGLNESLIVSMVIPLSLLTSLIVMNFYGITINTMSLVAFVVALGLLVDNAIVVMENIDRLRDMGVNRKLASKAGTNQVGPAVLAATVTTVGAFMPLAMQGGTMGQFISILPKTLIITILASLFVSICITPILSSKFLAKHKNEDNNHSRFKDGLSIVFVWVLTFVALLDNWSITIWSVILSFGFTGIVFLKIHLKNRKIRNDENKVEHSNYIDYYLKWLTQFLESRAKRWMILGIAILLLVLSLMTFPMGIIKLDLFPKEEPNSITVSVEAPEGYLLEDTYKITQYIEAKLYDIEDLESFNIVVGGNKKNKATVTVNLLDKELRRNSGFEVVDYLRDVVKIIPGAEFNVKESGGGMGGSSGSDVSVSLKGNNINELNSWAAKLLKVLENVEGVDSGSISSSGGAKEILIDINEDVLPFYGLNASSIASELRNRITGAQVGSYKELGESYDITAYYDDGTIESIDDFDNISFTNNKGINIPFSEVATVKIMNGMASIQHDDGSKVVTVEGNVKSGVNATQIGKVFDQKVKEIELPDGIEVVSGGAFNDANEQKDKMVMSFIVALFVVYMVLVIQFNSFLQPIVILMSVPFAFIGIILGLIITGNNLGVYAMMGIVALVGIAVNDAIVLIDYANYQRSVGFDVKESIIEAVKTRFLPVLATSLTTMGGTLPLALYNDTYSQLGYTIVFGLFASTVLTLLIIPLLYYMVETYNLPKLKIFKFKKSEGKIYEKQD